MSFLRKTTQAVSALLVLLMSTMLVLPPGMDLELCFGEDGHVDFSLNDCQYGASPEIPAKERLSAYDTGHHDDCSHLPVVCNTAHELIRAECKTDSGKFKLKKDPSKTPHFIPKSLADFSGGYLNSDVYSIPFEDFPSPHLVSLRTVVLLI